MDKLTALLDREPAKAAPRPLDSEAVRRLCLAAGAGDAGFVDIGREALDFERADILAAFPDTRTVLALVFPLNPANIRSQARNLSSAEIHHAGDELAAASHAILRELAGMGVRGVAAHADFPMDMGRYPGKGWPVSHKVMAVQAGLGHMGVNRLVLHPELGAFVRLAALLLDAEMDAYGAPLAESPCGECGLCAAVCPVGAVSLKEPFDFKACMTHAYRDNTRGFMDFIAALVQSGDMEAFRDRFLDRETASLWQSLMYKMNYRCGYCMAVCPAGRAGAEGYAGRRREYLDQVFRPLRDRQEEVYVLQGSGAEARAGKNPHKNVRTVGWGL